MLDNRFSIIFGNSVIIHGGWFDFVLIYSGVSFSLWYGEYFPVLRFKVVSKKSVIFRLPSMVIFNPSDLNTCIIFSSAYRIFAHCFVPDILSHRLYKDRFGFFYMLLKEV